MFNLVSTVNLFCNPRLLNSIKSGEINLDALWRGVEVYQWGWQLVPSYIFIYVPSGDHWYKIPFHSMWELPHRARKVAVQHFKGGGGCTQFPRTRKWFVYPVNPIVAIWRGDFDVNTVYRISEICSYKAQEGASLANRAYGIVGFPSVRD